MAIRMPRSCRGAVVFLVLVALGGCDGPRGGGRAGEGPGKREQRLALSPQQELELGRQAYREVLSNPQKYGRVVAADRPEVRRVREIAHRIVRASEIEPLQREINLRQGYRYAWEINVLEKADVNAFCLPGGKMVVFTGILRVVQNDAQLAAVIAHEISHALAHHGSERLARDQTNKSGFGGFWAKSYDREQESEADHIGVFLMTFAGYDPYEAVRFWERMEQASGGKGPPEILSDHPSNAHRIQALKVWAPKAVAAKRALDEGNVAPRPGR